MNRIILYLAIFATKIAFSQNIYPPTGPVGIGTSTPNSTVALDVNGKAFVRSLFYVNDIMGGNGGDIRIGPNTGGNSSTIFMVGGVNPTEVMRISYNNYVGIGTSAPTNKLDVVGSTIIGGGYVNANTTKLFLRNPLGKTWAVSSGANGVTENSFSIYNWTDNQTRPFFHIDVNGNVGVGTIAPDAKLAVNGTIHSKEVKVDLNVPAPDYVFANDYKLKSLQEVENYVNENNHLPEIPSAKEFEKNGIQLAEMNMALLKKVEELTLYAIEQNKRLDKIENENKELKNQISSITIKNIK